MLTVTFELSCLHTCKITRKLLFSCFFFHLGFFFILLNIYRAWLISNLLRSMFIRKYLFSWRHSEINSVFLLRLLVLSAFIIVSQLFYPKIVKAQSLRCRRTDILYAGESTQNIGETTRWRTDRLLWDVGLLDRVT